MNKQLKDSFRNSSLGRAQTTPKKRFHTFINDKLKRHRSDTGLVEDRTSSTTIVRTIVGLLLVHLVLIGGVLVRGHLVKSGSGLAIDPTLTPPPAASTEVLPTPPNATAATAPATPLPTLTPAPTAAQAAANTKPAQQTKPAQTTITPTVPTVTQPAVAANRNATPHITQLPQEEVAEEVDDTPAAPAQQTTKPAAPAQPVRTVTKKHLVASGDSWGRIAAQNGITVEALKAANPKSAAKPNLYAGTYLNVPIPADSAEGRSIAATQEQEAVIAKGKTYVVKKGDNLGSIARKHKISLKKLLDLNNMTEADAKKLKIGAELKVAE